MDISLIVDMLTDGWVSMDADGKWKWHSERPSQREKVWSAYYGSCINLSRLFFIRPVEDWEQSLIEVLTPAVCPFCGARANVVTHADGSKAARCHNGECPLCKLPPMPIKQWNTRS